MVRFGFTIFFVLLVTSASSACSVPVFRYALEKWAPSNYELIVLHRGGMSVTDRKAVAQLKENSRRANVSIVTVDLADGEDEANAERRANWAREGKDDQLPRLLLRYPDSGSKTASLWSGPLSTSVSLPLFDSPARQSLVDRLTMGNAGVILLLLSGDAKADAAARTWLRQEAPRVARRIELPAKTEEGPQVQSVLPLRVEFPIVEISREPAEETFVRMLLGSEDGLDKVRGPIAFLVFGRGRALCSLHGKDLEKPGELQRSLEFLCRACSCQVKELNPGIDLLISGNWEIIFEAETGPLPRVISESKMPPRAEPRPAGAGGPPQVEMRSPPPVGYTAAEEEGSVAPRRLPWMRLGLIAAALTASGFWVFRSRRPTPPDRN